MTQRDELYKCAKCGNIVGVMHQAGGTLVCCGQPMNLLTDNTEDAAVEKHVPVIEKIAGGYKVIVGEVNHPMVDAHYIEWIQLIAGDKVYTEYLAPGQTPEATFLIEAESVTAKAYCNLHGNWKKDS